MDSLDDRIMGLLQTLGRGLSRQALQRSTWAIDSAIDAALQRLRSQGKIGESMSHGRRVYKVS